jgi:hypothetical protein
LSRDAPSLKRDKHYESVARPARIYGGFMPPN